MTTDGAGPAAVRFEVDGGVITLTMDQPETRNALTPELVAGLAEGLTRAEATPGARVVVLTHTGPAFSAGADLRPGRSPASPPSGSAPDFAAVLGAIQDSPLPVVARIAGHCLGGGVGLAAACDLSVAADDVRIGFSEVRIGVAPAIISAVCLPKLNRADALELFLTGERIPAGRAAAMGLLTRVVPTAELDATVDAFVRSLLAGGPGALAAAKSLVYRVPGQDREEAFAWTSALSLELFATDEAAEGRAAFREKRPPAWSPGSPPRATAAAVPALGAPDAPSRSAGAARAASPPPEAADEPAPGPGAPDPPAPPPR